MSATGDRIAVVAEFGLWVTGAALIASAAGMRLPPVSLPPNLIPAPAPTHAPVDVIGLKVSPSPGSSATLEPSATAAPTISPVVQGLAARLASKDFQFKAAGTATESFVAENSSVDIAATGSFSYKAGDEAESTKMTSGGKTMSYDNVYGANNAYVRKNGGPWVKKPRQASDTAMWQIMLAPGRRFVDVGVETKNGARLHRLVAADPVALSSEIDSLEPGVGASHVNLTFWTRDDGTPVVFRLEGTWDQTVAGLKAHVTAAHEFVISNLSGVTIAPPAGAWQWIVDSIGIGFGVPPGWARTNVNSAVGWTTYGNATATIGYVTDEAGGRTFNQAVDFVEESLADPAQNRTETTVGGEPAARFGIHRSKQKDYVSETVVVHNGKIYQFVFFAAGKDSVADALASQILATLEFTS